MEATHQRKTIVSSRKHACVEQIDNHTLEIFAFIESIYPSFRLAETKDDAKKTGERVKNQQQQRQRRQLQQQ